MQSVNLFCFSYAGGSSALYNKWRNKPIQNINIIPIEYSGRGKRINESLIYNFDDMINDVYKSIKPYLYSNNPYCLFGYSLGGIIAYELAQLLTANLSPSPLHMFIASTMPPTSISQAKKLSNLNDIDFKKVLYKFGGTPKDVLNNDNLMEFFLPILRADFKVLDSYIYREKVNRLHCDLSILYGREDGLISQNIYKWKYLSEGECKFYKIPGDHFFIKEHSDKIIRRIASIIKQYRYKE